MHWERRQRNIFLPQVVPQVVPQGEEAVLDPYALEILVLHVRQLHVVGGPFEWRLALMGLIRIVPQCLVPDVHVAQVLGVEGRAELAGVSCLALHDVEGQDQN